ncbi:MAG: peptidase U32 family protein, partial [Bacteroidales bacterium]|nr:peptidase U32 family protein [Bacteroidales bacterium]
MARQREIELLAPAKNLECGIAAIDHGADAVYIGAPRFGARAAAGNSVADIAELVRYAHLYNVRIYVAVNTILRDEELEETERMVWELYRIGVDALIVQDMGLLRLHLPPIPLHASTQTDNRTPQKVKFLAEAGFRQVVLARELSMAEIEAVHRSCPDVALEVFVHGALCVSYSGQCYVSQACFGRSANRGECAQFCRLAFDMVDADGRIVARGKHLLSLKDMNRSEELEQLLDAGVSSLKIEG